MDKTLLKMGYHQKMKQEAKNIKAYENLYKRLTCPKSKEWIYSKLESSKHNYHMEKFSYNASIGIIVFIITGIIGLMLIYLNSQGVFK